MTKLNSMSSEKRWYTVSIYTENNVGLLNRISAIFQRRHINIESINTSISEIEGVSRWTIVVQMSEAQIQKVIGQIEKQVDVIRAYYHTDEETIYQECCLFKIQSDLFFEDAKIQKIIATSNVRIVAVEREFFVLEKAGKRTEIESLYKQLKPFGIMQFVRSARIAITKEALNISPLLTTLQEQ